MLNAKMYCLCLKDSHLNKVKKLNYNPVGLGPENFSKGWIRDISGLNISNKNSYYGEYTFHYWLWKNNLKEIDDNTWIGFCTYRRFWKDKKLKSERFQDQILKEIPKEWLKYDVILADKIDLTNVKWIKVLKYGKKAFLNNPKSIFKKYRNIKFQFDLNHGVGTINRAIKLLGDEDRSDFQKFILENTSFNQCNLFVCKSKKILEKYYKTVFKWLEKCEKEFGFNNDVYGRIRVYGFLAERFMPYWFRKNCNYLEWPIIFNDLDNENF